MYLVPCWLFGWVEKKMLSKTSFCGGAMKNYPSSLDFFSQVRWTSAVCFFGQNEAIFTVFFSNGTLLNMENFPWQSTDYRKFSLVSLLPLEKNLAKLDFQREIFGWDEYFLDFVPTLSWLYYYYYLSSSTCLYFICLFKMSYILYNCDKRRQMFEKQVGLNRSIVFSYT